MNRHRLVLASMSVFALATFGVGAQEPGRQGPPPPGFGPGRGGSPGLAIFMLLDADHDNTLSAAEIGNAATVLKALDKNGDGIVSVDELPIGGRGRGGPGGRGERGGGSGIGDQPPAQPPTPDELLSMLMAFDKNGDGKLTKSELPERFQGLFDRADTNHDGMLTAEEIKASAAAQPQSSQMEGRRGGEGERGGPERGRGDGRGPGRDPLFAALDQNGDGSLSADEIAAAPASLRKLDLNGDGILSLMEVFGAGRG